MQTARYSSSSTGEHFLEEKPAAPALVVSIHDVSTVTRNRVGEMIRDLSDEGASVTSLLVIPDHHHRGQIDHDPEFGGWLRALVAGGHEAVLHGFHHLRTKKENEGVATRLITSSYTAGEGEFYDLSRVEAAVREAGFEYTTRIGGVIDCQSVEKFSSRSLVYSVRAPWRRGISLLWNEGLFRATGGNPLLRIGLHPPDWDYPAIRYHALSCIRRAVQNRDVTTYARWLDQWRASGH